ncbi:hypothetical protein EDB80DRAFT_266311 [Ilyonectria destructans]|nr:hypothetical protein EDB80DRAFT_266311 [Ilyonectria destructans]
MKSSRFRHLSARRWGQQALKSEFTEFALWATLAELLRLHCIFETLSSRRRARAAMPNMINEGQSVAGSPCAAGGLIGHKSYIVCGAVGRGNWVRRPTRGTLDPCHGNAMNWELGAARQRVVRSNYRTQGWGTLAFAFPSWNMQWIYNSWV